MKFKEFNSPALESIAYLPSDIVLQLPEKSNLPLNMQHYLFFIPWEDEYLDVIPREFVDFFTFVLPYLHVRTTDVHTALCLGYLDQLLMMFPVGAIDRRVVALALILHDSGWSRLSEEEVAASLEVKGLVLTQTALGPKEKHALESEKIAREVLNECRFVPPLSQEEIELVCKAVLYHDKPEEVAGAEKPMPLEVQLLVDLDHLWSFTHQNFWQDTLRKGVKPSDYLANLSEDLDGYFVTNQGKELARTLLEERKKEISELPI